MLFLLFHTNEDEIMVNDDDDDDDDIYRKKKYLLESMMSWYWSWNKPCKSFMVKSEFFFFFTILLT